MLQTNKPVMPETQRESETSTHADSPTDTA